MLRRILEAIRRGRGRESPLRREADPIAGAAPEPSEDLDTQIRAYSRRMIPPYTGQLQIAETRHARAFSIDGRHWEIQLRLGADTPATQSASRKEPGRYVAIARISPAGMVCQPLPAALDTEAVRRFLHRLGARAAGLRVLLDPEGGARRRWQVRALPVTYLVGPGDASVGARGWDLSAARVLLHALAAGPQP